MILVRGTIVVNNRHLPIQVYAEARVNNFPELITIKGMLSSKYGRTYVKEAGSDGSCRRWSVNEKLIQ